MPENLIVTYSGIFRIVSKLFVVFSFEDIFTTN